MVKIDYSLDDYFKLEPNKIIYIKDKEGEIHKVNSTEIFYIEFKKDYRMVHLTSPCDAGYKVQWVTDKSADMVLKELGQSFIKVYRNYIIQRNYVCGRSADCNWAHLKFYCNNENKFTSYHYAANNPIYFIDVDGKYIMSAETQQKCELLAQYLNSGLIFELLESETFVTNMKSFGQFETTEEIKETFTNVNEPTIAIGEDIGWPHEGALARYDHENNTIYLDQNNLIDIVNSSKDVEAAMVLLVSTLMNETVHYGDWRDGTEDDNQEVMSKIINGIPVRTAAKDKGDLFKSKVYLGDEWGDNGIYTIEQARGAINNYLSKTSEGRGIIPTVPSSSKNSGTSLGDPSSQYNSYYNDKKYFEETGKYSGFD